MAMYVAHFTNLLAFQIILKCLLIFAEVLGSQIPKSSTKAEGKQSILTLLLVLLPIFPLPIFPQTLLSTKDAGGLVMEGYVSS